MVWIKKSISHNKISSATHKAFMILKIVAINKFRCLWLMINSYYQIWIKKHKYCNQNLPLLITIFHDRILKYTTIPWSMTGVSKRQIWTCFVFSSTSVLRQELLYLHLPISLRDKKNPYLSATHDPPRFRCFLLKSVHYGHKEPEDCWNNKHEKVILSRHR